MPRARSSSARPSRRRPRDRAAIALKEERPNSLRAFRPRDRAAIALKEERPNSLRAFRNDARALEVVVLDRQRRHATRPERLRRVLRRAASALDVSGEVSLMLAGDERVRALNARYRGKDKPTDVLSFPGEGGVWGLGDIIISVPTAAQNARAYGRSLAQELDVLALHGFLHVLGYDHETDDGTMDRLERRLRRALL